MNSLVLIIVTTEGFVLPQNSSLEVNIYTARNITVIYTERGANALIIIIIEGTLVFVVLPIIMVCMTMNSINGDTLHNCGS